VDTLDSVGLTAASFLSMITNGLIPPPPDRPSRERVDLFVNLLSNFLSLTNEYIVKFTLENSPITKSNPNNAVKASTSLNPDGLLTVDLFINFLNYIVTMLSDPLSFQSAALRNDLARLMYQASTLLVSILARLAEINAQRALRLVVNPNNIESLLSGLSSVVEFLNVIQDIRKNASQKNENPSSMIDSDPEISVSSPE
jgi:hypothetical protein